jgi:hypothetical protein
VLQNFRLHRFLPQHFPNSPNAELANSRTDASLELWNFGASEFQALKYFPTPKKIPPERRSGKPTNERFSRALLLWHLEALGFRIFLNTTPQFTQTSNWRTTLVLFGSRALRFKGSYITTLHFLRTLKWKTLKGFKNQWSSLPLDIYDQ